MADFTTDINSMYFTDNIWNDSSWGANMTSIGVSGNGSVSPSNFTDTAKQYYYGCTSQTTKYNFPFSFNFTISIAIATDSVSITFGYQVLTNGQNSKMQNPINYDVATIKAPEITNSSIIINGWNQTPSGYAYDAELVFGGEFWREKTTFTEMNATLNMYYLTSNETIVTPYALYGFGSDTGEAAYNLETIMANGTYTVVLGEPNFTESYISVPIPFVRLSISSFNDKIGSTNLFYANSNVLLNLSVIGGFAPFNYSLMDNGTTVNEIPTTNNRTISFSYSPSSMGDHILTIAVTDTAGNSISSKPIIESYYYDYKTIASVGLTIVILILLAVIAYSLLRKRDLY
jgi:thermopsin